MYLIEFIKGIIKENLKFEKILNFNEIQRLIITKKCNLDGTGIEFNQGSQF